MKIRILITLFFLMLSSISAYADYQTTLLSGVYIPNVDVGDYSTPVVYDWNNDGRKDLIIGSRTGAASTGFHGYVNFYENTGSDSSPSFSSSSQIQSCTTACSAIDALAGG
jgi:hypothetical protein